MQISACGSDSFSKRPNAFMSLTACCPERTEPPTRNQPPSLYIYIPSSKELRIASRLLFLSCFWAIFVVDQLLCTKASAKCQEKRKHFKAFPHLFMLHEKRIKKRKNKAKKTSSKSASSCCLPGHRLDVVLLGFQPLFY